MTNTIVIGTNNAGKAREFRAIFEPKGLQVKTLADFPTLDQVAETGQTFTENATLKATAVAQATQLPVLADDSGLMVDALNGAPGIYSARYAGDHDDAKNNAKLLAELHDVPAEKRGAAFHTSLVLIKPNGKKLVATGEVRGEILTAPRGADGFGYDPLFYVPAEGQTFAEMGLAQKNQHSHRAKATAAMLPQFDQWWED
ncbi:XTP/dITP diphosphatase [Levilactobacillus brevis]|jgi:XTP/dITP diphosphohydrolase|uniref:dITP/XTP pyrophosphatase n=2 Tax=Levilactobacillus brevis TaxID=1580 RepID=Q03R53_LEVBA|nr:XTP/dITP diphosphatase [Levilactobacillus brevis]ABJ64319.1 Xanthosine triphosphate pyrophosphatase [Levilactobacillus brevis ATCC 367]ARQ93707.1 non-canonical purine NTP pyrophosphatase [Levilactobacillus brevis]KWT49924.1 nucleoside-triphosphate diphosphatase [Levilactobacillus brevis]KWU39268.1 non-canonical purine NTP pyrophosphatase [Levilactobacillus brevis]MCB4356302.1 XTP/dITP diphosphatase [Levilactobacillus brevis]